jgi:hypothetical protein
MELNSSPLVTSKNEFIHIRETLYIYIYGEKERQQGKNPETSSPLLEKEKKRKETKRNETKERHAKGMI